MRTSEAHLSAALRAGRMATFDWNSADHSVVFSNSGADVFGTTRGTIFPTSDAGFELVHPEDRARHRATFENAAARGEDYHSEYRIIRPRDGEVAWIEEWVAAARDPVTGAVRLNGIAWDITDRKRAEQALRMSEEQFRRAIEDAPVPVIMFTEDSQVLQTSRTWTRLTGYRPQELRTFDAWLDQAYGAGAHQVRDQLAQLFRGERRLLNVEVSIRTRDDDMRYWSFSAATPGSLRDGRRFVVGMAVDLTERHRWERALRESEERFRLLVQSVQDHAIFVMDPAGLVMSWNEGAERILGYTEEEILGQPGATFFTAEDRARGMSERELSTAATTGRATDENWLVRKDGSRFWASGATSALRDESGDLRGFAKIFRDLTERKNAEDALREKEERLRVALDAAGMGTWRWDLVTGRQILDESLHRLLGNPPRPIESLDDMLTHIHPDDRERVAQAFHRSVQDTSVLNVEFRIPLPDGSVRWLKDQGDIIRAADGRPLYMTGACVDITERKEAEQALRENHTRLEVALEGAQAAAHAKDQFLAALSHELRTPLMPVMLTVSMLQEEEDVPRELRKDLAMIRRNIETEARMVDDLLDLSRIINHKLEINREPGDVHEILRSAVEVCRPAAQHKSIAFTTSLRAQRTIVQADAARLQQVFWNLVQNAVKFTPRGGRITVRSTNVAEDRVRIDVTDTGRGIEPALLARIFEPFEQGDRRGKESLQGLGLGLTIARRIVEAHEGELSVASAGRNCGATFSVILQLAETEPEKQDRPAQTRSRAIARARRISQRTR